MDCPQAGRVVSIDPEWPWLLAMQLTRAAIFMLVGRALAILLFYRFDRKWKAEYVRRKLLGETAGMDWER